MHLLSAKYRSEFLVTPQLIRFDHVKGSEHFEPTLLIKASTLLLKYIVQGVEMELFFAQLGNQLLYALKVKDDETKAGILWSILEHEQEKAALIEILQGTSCQIFLFNELAVNVAWRSQPVLVHKNLATMIDRIITGPVDHSALEAKTSAILDQFHNKMLEKDGFIVAEIPNTTAWNPIFNHFVTSHATGSLIDLFHSDEGNQQEQLAVWLTDNLHPHGVQHSPQIPKGKNFRELTDILLSYQYGSFLIESKSLSIFSRDRLPNRTKLARDITGHIKKALNQLHGGIRRLKNGTKIVSKDGLELNVERTQPVHGIILIPDLDLIDDHNAYGHELIKDFMENTGGFLHLLDIAELLRIVQAVEMISAHGTNTTHMMAFDFYLMERAKKAYEVGTLCIEVLLRFADE
jgi:hypothetical protein